VSKTLEVADRLALADLVHAYAAAVDDRRFDDAADLFTETAELKLPDPPQSLEPVRLSKGRAAIRSAVASVTAVQRTQHAIVGEVYWSGAKDTARGRIACLAHHFSQRDEGFSDLLWHTRYDDLYARTDAGWRIQVRTLTINAIEVRPIRRLR
jgi:3-phenylpropionate/cinnamic acid dioxygenase small subunit